MTLYIDCIRDALDRCLAADPRVCIIGEDLLDPYGGAFRATKGLSTKYPGRIHTTPISESAIIGIATGMAMRGMRPVAEIMFGDFMTLCADQIINSATKFPLMYKGKVKVPSVIRTPVGGARGYGPTHSQSLEKLFFGVPGLRIVAPNRLCDPGHLLEYSILGEECPTLFIEDKGDYAHRLFPCDPRSLEMKEMGSGTPYPIVFSRNFVGNKNPDITILSYGGGASMAAKVLDELAAEEIRGMLIAPTEVNNPDTLRKIIEALPRSTPVIIAEQGTHGFGWSSEIMALMLEAGRVDCKVKRLAARPDVIPAARHLEADVILTEISIKHSIYEVLT